MAENKIKMKLWMWNHDILYQILLTAVIWNDEKYFVFLPLSATGLDCKHAATE